MTVLSAPATNVSQAALQEFKNRPAYVHKVETSALEDSLKKLNNLFQINHNKAMKSSRDHIKAASYFSCIDNIMNIDEGKKNLKFFSPLFRVYAEKNNANNTNNWILFLNAKKDILIKYDCNLCATVKTTLNEKGYSIKGYLIYDKNQDGLKSNEEAVFISETIPPDRVKYLINLFRENDKESKLLKGKSDHNIIDSYYLISRLEYPDQINIQEKPINYKEANKVYKNTLKTVLQHINKGYNINKKLKKIRY